MSSDQPPLGDEDFREYTAAELAAAISAAGGPGDPAEIEVQDPAGEVVATGLLRLHVGTGTDFDRTGTYEWTKITARAEPTTAQAAEVLGLAGEVAGRVAGAEIGQRLDALLAAGGGLGGKPADYVSISRPDDAPDWDRLQQVVAIVEAWKAAGTAPETAMRDLFDVYAASYLAVNRATANVPGGRFTSQEQITVTSAMGNSWLEGFLYGVLFQQAGGHREQ